jgi:hypothetical protein
MDGMHATVILKALTSSVRLAAETARFWQVMHCVADDGAATLRMGCTEKKKSRFDESMGLQQTSRCRVRRHAKVACKLAHARGGFGRADDGRYQETRETEKAERFCGVDVATGDGGG